jgi:hypothetical protein
MHEYIIGLYVQQILPAVTTKVVALKWYELCLGVLPLLEHSCNSSFGIIFNAAAKFSEMP